mmetsp:Transcript_12409/g.32851  ORF Transcript_12409/g.32851 Transcript_12409/m.32851 type:complete len:327 (+) Transcript_12409:158-1138(+)
MEEEQSHGKGVSPPSSISLLFLREPLVVAHIRAVHAIAPRKDARVVADVDVVVVIVVLGPRVERAELVDRPRKFVPGVNIDRLVLPHEQPDDHGNKMRAHHQRARKRRDPEEEDLDGVCVGGCDGERRVVLVVDGVDLLVEELRMQRAVEPVVEVVLDQEEHAELRRDDVPRGQRRVRGDADGVEDRERADQHGENDDEEEREDSRDGFHVLRGPGVFRLLDLVLLEEGDAESIKDDVGDTAEEVAGDEGDEETPDRHVPFRDVVTCEKPSLLYGRDGDEEGSGANFENHRGKRQVRRLGRVTEEAGECEDVNKKIPSVLQVGLGE